MSLNFRRFTRQPVLPLLLLCCILLLAACGESMKDSDKEADRARTAAEIRSMADTTVTAAAEAALTANGEMTPASSPSEVQKGASVALEATVEPLLEMSGKTPEELIEVIRNEKDPAPKSAEAELIRLGSSALDKVIAAYVEACSIEELKIAAEYEEDKSAERKLKKLGLPANEMIDIKDSLSRVLIGIGKPAVLPLLNMVDKNDTSIQGGVSLIIGSIGNDAVDTLISNLKPKLHESSLCAIQALGSIGDPKAVESLLSIAKGENGWDREHSDAAFQSLLEIGKESVIPLIELFESEKNYPNKHAKLDAAEILGKIGDLRAIEPLLGKLNSKDSRMRFSAARGLAGIEDSSVDSAMEDALANGKLDIVAGASEYFIDHGDDSTRDVLIKALNKFGDSETAEDFLNSNDEKLEEAGRAWADENGYMITSFPIPG